MTPIPLILVVVFIPLALGIVPRNRLYGVRLPSTLSSDAAWYRTNRIVAVACIAAGAAWVLMQLLLPLALPSQPTASRWADGLGWAVLGVAMVGALRACRQPTA